MTCPVIFPSFIIRMRLQTSMSSSSSDETTMLDTPSRDNFQMISKICCLAATSMPCEYGGLMRRENPPILTNRGIFDVNYFFLRLGRRSNATAMRMTRPLTTCCQSAEMPIMDIPLFRMPMTKQPTSAPAIVPPPPETDAPPT